MRLSPWSDWFKKPAPTLAALGLEPLYADSDAPGQDEYVAKLHAAVTNTAISNIALTASYGSGKSSILERFAKEREQHRKTRGRIIRISLATLGKKSKDDGDSKEHSNKIQKEIIKQLLFHEAPHKVPASKFKRISPPTKLRLFLAALLAAMALPVAYLMSQAAVHHFTTLDMYDAQAATLLLALSAWIISLPVIIFACTNNFVMSKLSGGPVTFELNEKSTAYFDKYLDEIIYFFQMTKYDIVIFEDIERFDNTLIFKTLKQLNNLLNQSGQLRARYKRVRFIYAIKDTLFSLSTPAIAAYAQGTDRAKFFDLIIPVVPFVTHESSGDIFNHWFNTKHHLGISKEVISTVAAHITDMRLIKNILNEYLIFSRKVLGKDKLEGLTRDKLFAMMAYKNTNLEDFERIQTGTSKLNDIYDSYRETIADDAARIAQDIATKRLSLATPGSLTDRSKQYGQKLTDYLQMTLAAIRATRPEYNLHGVGYQLEELAQPPFWEAVNTMGPTDTVTTGYISRHGYREDLLLDKADLERVVGHSLDLSTLEATDRQALKEEINQLRKQLKSTRKMPIEDLLKTSAVFRTAVDSHLETGVCANLIRALLAAGYIDAYFTLYTSIFHGTDPKATNFVIHHLKLDKVDHFYKFDSDESIKQMLQDATGYTRSKTIYNIDVMDYLLRTAKPGAHIHPEAHALSHIITNLAHGEPEDQAFLNDYLQQGTQPEKLIERLSSRWEHIFDYLAVHPRVSKQQKAKLFSAAMEGSNRTVQYQTEEDIQDFIAENAGRIDFLSKDNASFVYDNAHTLLIQLKVRFPVLSILNSGVRQIVIENSLYAITRQNLQEVLGSRIISLDNLLARNETAFAYVTADLDAYLAALADTKRTAYTIRSNERFVPILEHIAQSEPDYLPEIIKRAAPGCSVQQLSQVNPLAWPALLNLRAVAPLLSNLLTYYQQQATPGPLDEHMTSYLERVSGFTHDIPAGQESEPALQSFGLAILGSKTLPAGLQSQLVQDLQLKAPLDVDSFEPRDGQLYGLLVDNGTIADSAATYMHLKNTNTSIATRLYYLEHARAASSYLPDISLDAQEVAAIATSQHVDATLKQCLVLNLAALDPVPADTTSLALADFALTQRIALPSDTLTLLAGAIAPATAVKLINLTHGSLTRDEILALLVRIGGDYQPLTEPRRHPILPFTDFNATLVQRLQELGVVSSSKKEQGGRNSIIRVNMRPRW